MAISPVVQGYQQSMFGQDEAVSKEYAFNQKFGQAAYNSLRSKYPSLLSNLVTFKTVESDPDTGTALGAFILSRGSDVVYIPVVLAGGSVVSCEMLYDKTADLIRPLTDSTVKSLVRQVTQSAPQIQKNPPYVENTKAQLRNMFRPPTSTNPTLASAGDLEMLPGEARTALSETFKANPVLLAKVAEFYPVEHLAERLAVEEVDSPENFTEIPDVIKLSEVTEELSALLSSIEKEDLLSDGYTVRDSAFAKTAEVIPTSDIPADAVTNFSLTEWAPNREMYGHGNLVKLTGGEITTEPCLVLGKSIFTSKGRVRISGGVVLSDFQEGVTEDALKKHGAIKPSEASAPSAPNGFRVIYPTRYGKFKESESQYWVPIDGKQVIDGEVVIGNSVFTNALTSGCIESKDGGNDMFPSRSWLMPISQTTQGIDATSYMKTLQEVITTIQKTAPRVRIVNNGAGNTVLDSHREKTASFRHNGDLLAYLGTEYGMTREAALQTLDSRDVLVVKTAAQYPMQRPAYADNTTSESPSGTFMARAAGPMQPQEQLKVNQELLESSAQLGDKDIMDTGMLASLADNESIKTLLLDMVPGFSGTTSDIGKTILLFCANSKDLEDHYGSEEYTSLLNSLRKTFRSLGEIVWDLEDYMNMH